MTMQQVQSLVGKREAVDATLSGSEASPHIICMHIWREVDLVLYFQHQCPLEATPGQAEKAQQN